MAGTGSGGTGGTGATGGAGGAGGSGGGSTNLRCGPGATVAVGDKPLIDDFNDGDLLIIHPEEGTEDGRAGEFYAAENGAPTIENPGTELHFSVNAAGAWASFGIPVAECYDAAAYAGVRFKIKGTAKNGGTDITNPIKFVLATPPTTPEPAGTCPCPDTGVCAACYDAFGYFVPSLNPTEYATVEVLWGQLKQGGWGNAAPPGYLAQKEIIELAWGMGTDTGEYDVYLDDVEFMK